MSNGLECKNCSLIFNRTNRRPYIGTCRDLLCEECKNRLIGSDCPMCKKKNAYEDSSIHLSTLCLMKTVFGVIDELQENDEICSECGDFTTKLLVCIDCALKEHFVLKKHDGSYTLDLWRFSHSECPFKAATEKLLELKIASCRDCSLLGYHKKHDNRKYLNALRDEEEWTKIRAHKVFRDIKERLFDFQDRCSRDIEGIIGLVDDYNRIGFKLSLDEHKKHLENLKEARKNLFEIIGPAEEALKKIREASDEVFQQGKYVARLQKAYAGISIGRQQIPQPILTADRSPFPTKNFIIGSFDPFVRKWTVIGKMPKNKINYSVAVYQNEIYFAGGGSDESQLDELDIYNKEKNLRRNGSPLNHARSRSSAGFFNGKMFLCGGFNGSYMTSVEIYDPEENRWVDGPSLNCGRSDCAVVSCDGELFVMGGYNGKEYEKRTEKLNCESKKWEIVAEMREGVAGFAACVFNRKIYIAGGWSNSLNTLNTVRSFDPKKHTWHGEPSMNKRRKNFTLLSTEDSLFAIRGCAEDGSLYEDVEELEVCSSEWKILPGLQ